MQFKRCLGYAHDDELSDAVSALDLKRLVRVQIDENRLQLASVTAVDKTGSIY